MLAATDPTFQILQTGIPQSHPPFPVASRGLTASLHRMIAARPSASVLFLDVDFDGVRIAWSRFSSGRISPTHSHWLTLQGPPSSIMKNPIELRPAGHTATPPCASLGDATCTLIATSPSSASRGLRTRHRIMASSLSLRTTSEFERYDE